MSKRTKGETCESVLLEYLQTNEGWHKKVHLYAVAEDWSAETVGRDLRTMAEEGKIYVDYYDGKISKNLAMYSSKPKEAVKLPTVTIIEMPDGTRKAVMG